MTIRIVLLVFTAAWTMCSESTKRKRNETECTTPVKKMTKRVKSPDKTPKQSTSYFSREANLVDIIGLRRLREKASVASHSTLIMTAPFFTHTRLRDELLANHDAGVKQIVIVSPQSRNSAVTQTLAAAGIDVRVHPRVHTKTVYRMYYDADGNRHMLMLLGSANPTHKGYYHNTDSFMVLPEECSAEYQASIDALVSEANSVNDASYSKDVIRSSPKRVLFTPEKKLLDTRFHDVSDKIVRSIDKVGAGGEIVVSTFTLNDRAFLDSLRAAQERGVSVVLYVEATAKLPAEAYELGSAIKRVSMPHGIQHDKTVVCHENGSYKTYYGSANRTCGHNSVDQVFLTQSAEFGSNHMQKLHDMLAPYVQKQ